MPVGIEIKLANFQDIEYIVKSAKNTWYPWLDRNINLYMLRKAK